MTPIFRRFVAFALVALGFAMPAAATTTSVDYTDQWWVATESGWGVNITQQQEILFVTLFVYGPDRSPRWYVGPATAPVTPQPAGQVAFSGLLYSTTGPAFSTPFFDPATVVPTAEGAITLTFSSPTQDVLSYTVGTTTVTKTITRQPIRNVSLTGRYQGGMVVTASNCTNSGDNGATYAMGTLTVAHGVSQVTMTTAFVTPAGLSATCTYVGAFVGQGRLASLTGGTWSCVSGTTTFINGTFTLTGIDAQANGFHGTFAGADQFCTYNGRFGGTRDVIGN